MSAKWRPVSPGGDELTPESPDNMLYLQSVFCKSAQ